MAEGGDRPGVETILTDDPRPETSAAPAEPHLERGATLGRYIVVERIGGGGMGVVYAAYDPALDRKVALKLLRASSFGDPERRRVRLLREGQALARLAHPNVVAVHDVGAWEDRVFIAMEFVDGQTLRDWLGARARRVAEILDVFRQAGRALAAAHALGIVHRDFKPDNTLVDGTGRVRVVDFGLARASEADDETPTPSYRERPSLEQSLTLPGTAVGTPAYMAPEQVVGRADARADQYSFAVTLFEALFGHRPTQGEDPPRDARVPAFIRSVIGRALRSSPEERWPSMDTMLAALGNDPAQRRRRWLAAMGIAGLCAATAAGALWLRAREAPVCGGASDRLAGVWDDARRKSVGAAFAATGLPFATDAFGAADRALTAYADRWGKMYVGACEATRVRGEQSEQALDLRMECLARRRDDLRALGDVLARADGKTVEKAPQAAAALGAIDDCANLPLLRSAVPHPLDLHARDRVVTLRSRLAEARALEVAAAYPAAFALAIPAALEAVSLRYRQLEAESFLVIGQLQYDVGDNRAADRSLRTAVYAGEAGRHAVVVAQAATLLIRVHAYDDVGQWGERASAAVEAVGPDARLRSQLENNLGVVAYVAERWDEALRRHRAALLAREQEYGSESPLVAASLSNIGLVQYSRGELDDAIETHHRAVAIGERVYGAKHPKVAELRENLGASLLDQGRYSEALEVYQQSRTVKEAALGPDAAGLAVSYTGLGNAYYGLRRFEDSLAAHRRALAIKERTLGPEHSGVANTLSNVANVLFELGRLQDARAIHQRALRIKEKLLGPDHTDVAHTVNGLAEIARVEGRADEAIALYRRAVAIWEKALGPDYPLLASPLTGWGQTLLARGAAAAAIVPLERALAIREKQRVDAAALAGTRLSLARALWQGGGDRARARTLAEAAAAGPQPTEARDWLAARR